MRSVIYWNSTENCFCLTNKRNYDSYVQNAREIMILHDVKTMEDVEEFIRKCNHWWGTIREDYEVIK